MDMAVNPVRSAHVDRGAAIPFTFHDSNKELSTMPLAGTALEYDKSAKIREDGHGCVRHVQMLKYTASHLLRIITPRLALSFVLLFHHRQSPAAGAPRTLHYPPG